MVIFYADDDKKDRDSFCEAVKQIDPSASLIFAEDGKEALEILSQPTADRPDVIFLDINMPIMDGFETLVEIRKDKRYRNTKIILYSTGYVPKIQEYHTAFNVEFARKHNEIKDIKESIESVL